MVNLRGIISQLSGARRGTGGAGGRPTGGRGAGAGTRGVGTSGVGGKDDALTRGVRRFLRRR